jgi:hypothetical protein
VALVAEPLLLAFEKGLAAARPHIAEGLERAPSALGKPLDSGRDSGGTADLSIERFRIDREGVGIRHFARIIDEKTRLVHRVGGREARGRSP